MNRDLDGSIAARIGFGAALTLGLLFVLYIFCFVGILGSGPLFTWQGLDAFLSYIKTYDQTLKYAAYAGMLVFGFAWVALAEAMAASAGDGKRLFAQLGATFGALFALASGANYFVQLTGVRLSIAAGDTAGLSQVMMANPISVLSSLNMLGWTLLLGLSCLFLSFAVESGRGARLARAALRATGCVCITAGIAFALNCTWAVALCMYPGLGGGVILSSAALAARFHGSIKGEL